MLHIVILMVKVTIEPIIISIIRVFTRPNASSGLKEAFLIPAIPMHPIMIINKIDTIKPSIIL